MTTTLQDAEDMLMAYSCLSIGTNPYFKILKRDLSLFVCNHKNA